MKKYFIVAIAVLALAALSIPASAETVFNEMSKCVKSWGKGCSEPCEPAATSAATPAPKACMKKDVLGNKIPGATDNSGKTKLGT
ncbi:MAG: hypothetical protein PHI58_03995 [Candidatus Omnitrophica bacterium]|nr:hypothetical protein [Candidatus Omnitrophota bacterium]